MWDPLRRLRWRTGLVRVRFRLFAACEVLVCPVEAGLQVHDEVCVLTATAGAGFIIRRLQAPISFLPAAVRLRKTYIRPTDQLWWQEDTCAGGSEDDRRWWHVLESLSATWRQVQPYVWTLRFYHLLAKKVVHACLSLGCGRCGAR